MTARVVFDCMVFLQGAGRPASPARACFRLVDEEQITLCLSRDRDFLDLMNDPLFRQRFPKLQILDPVAFLQAIEKKREN